MAEFTEKHPEVFRNFRKHTKTNISPVSNWDISAERVDEICRFLSAQLKEIQPGNEGATQYHRTIVGILELLFKERICVNFIFSHTHSYTWTTVKEVSIGEDGLEEYVCSCGDVQERCVIPASAAIVNGFCNAVKNAPINGIAEYDSGWWYTMSDYFIRELAKRPDVTTVVTFEYERQMYKMTIPAGVDYTALLADEDYFYGYFYFANAVGATIETIKIAQ